jgi:hypothetical protein
MALPMPWEAPGIELTDNATQVAKPECVARTRFCVRLFRFQGAIGAEAPGTRPPPGRIPSVPCLSLQAAIGYLGEITRYRCGPGASTPGHNDSSKPAGSSVALTGR